MVIPTLFPLLHRMDAPDWCVPSSGVGLLVSFHALRKHSKGLYMALAARSRGKTGPFYGI